MLNSFFSKAAGFASAVDAWGLRQLSKRTSVVCLELFVAVCLTVNFFYLVRTQCAPKPNGNQFSAFSFIYLWDRDTVNDVIPVDWRTRLAAPTLSSWYAETQISPSRYAELKKSHPDFGDMCRTPEFQRVFGFYHSAWLFLLFMLLVCLRRDALLIMLGVFAGLMYNFAEPAGAYYYPWDMPAMFFFTLACLTFERGWIWTLLPVVMIGGIFKETILCCSLLILLDSHWSWSRRIAAFLGTVLVTLCLNRLLMVHYGLAEQVLALHGASSLPGLLHKDLLFSNLKSLFGAAPFHVIFANAGSLLLVMLVPWRNRRELLLKLVIIVFAIGLLFYGVITEVRIWYEVLPVGWMLISGALSAPGSTRNVNPRWRWSYWLTVGGLLVMLAGVFVFERLNKPSPKSNEQIVRELTTAATTGNPDAQYELGRHYGEKQAYQEEANWYMQAAEQGHAEAQFGLASLMRSTGRNDRQARVWFARAAAQGHALAKYRLGIMCWNGDGGRDDPDEALRLFHEAAGQGELNAQKTLGKIYLSGDGVKVNLVEAYKWLRLAALQGQNEARVQWHACSASMTAGQVVEAEKQVREFLKSNK